MMNWRYKALLQSLFSVTPGGASLNYAFQRYITRSMPAPKAKMEARIGFAQRHLGLIGRHLQTPLAQTTFYEFGAGADLAIPLALQALGVKHQILVDIRQLARPFLVNATIHQLHGGAAPFLPDDRTFVESLHTFYGIDYRAPSDARHTGLPPGSIDCITSTDTLEHIPERDIGPILTECHRLLREGGVMSFQIDYRDHYAAFDPGISVYNFFRYSDPHWALFSQSLQYQNRMRHSDYIRQLSNAGFDVLDQFLVEGSPTDVKTVQEIQLAPRFRHYDPIDLAIRGCALSLRRI